MRVLVVDGAPEHAEMAIDFLSSAVNHLEDPAIKAAVVNARTS
jgi:hypothetical protein